MIPSSFVSVLVLVTVSVAVQLPSYMEKCSKTDPDVGKCVARSANLALPHLIEGIKEFKIPKLNPLVVAEVEAEQGPNFKITLRNVKTYGIPNAIVKNADIDFEKKTWKLDVLIPKYTLLADYEMNGRLLFLPIHGDGPCNITIVNGYYNYTMYYDFQVNKKTGKEHIHILRDDTKVEVERTYTRFERLFNGDKRLGDEMNKFLDENWKEFHNEMKEPIEATTGTVITSILNAFFKTVPFDDIVLP